VASGAALTRTPGRGGGTAPSLAFRGELQGSLDARPQPVTLAFEGRAAARELVLTRLRAASGAASADFSATLQGGAGPRWQARSEGRLDSFDPLLWFPGEEGSAWRRGPHRLHASWKLELGIPDDALTLAPVQLLQSLQGEGQLDLQVADAAQ
jgi:translocation and assembly module TamB